MIMRKSMREREYEREIKGIKMYKLILSDVNMLFDFIICW